MPALLEQYLKNVQATWDRFGGRPQAAEAIRQAMEELFAATPADQDWALALLEERPRAKELYRDPERGFIQMGHFHTAGHATPPHDHGPGWVVYGVYRGELEISTYQPVQGVPDRLRLNQAERLGPGQARVYLPGTIHATRTLNPDGAVVFRFLSLDLNAVTRSHYRWDQVVAG
jgi:predicted metal-dependent enzyme (double-stranded beta helix superfamily)